MQIEEEEIDISPGDDAIGEILERCKVLMRLKPGFGLTIEGVGEMEDQEELEGYKKVLLLYRWENCGMA